MAALHHIQDRQLGHLQTQNILFEALLNDTHNPADYLLVHTVNLEQEVVAADPKLSIHTK